MGRLLEEVVGLVDENDRKQLSDPVKEAVGGGNGNPHSLSRRAVLLGKASGEERAIELAASPLRDGRRARWRGHPAARRHRAARPASADVLSGDPRCAHRPREPPRVRAPSRRSGRSRAAWRGIAHVVLPRSRPVQDRQRHAADISRATACCAKWPSCCAKRCAIPTRLRGSAATSSACCWSAVRSTRPGRSPTTCAVRSPPIVSCGTTASSTSACPSASSRSAAKQARSSSCSPPRIRPVTPRRKRARAACRCTRRATKRWRAAPARSSGCRSCKRRSRKNASRCTTSPSFRPMAPIPSVLRWKSCCACSTKPAPRLRRWNSWRPPSATG